MIEVFDGEFKGFISPNGIEIALTEYIEAHIENMKYMWNDMWK